MIWMRWFCAMAVAFLLAACNKPAPAVPLPSTNAATRWVPTQANPRLPTVKLWLGARELDAELCVTREQMSTGLMFRDAIKDDDLMLFIFGNASRRSFYMLNVKFDIDVAYITSEGIISEVVRLKAQDATPVPSRSDNIQFALEAVPGWFEKNNLRAGSLIRTPQGSLREVLGPRAQWFDRD